MEELNAERRAELEECNLFDITNNDEARIYEIPFVGTPGDEEAYYFKNDSCDNRPLQFSIIVFDNAWQGKMPLYELFQKYEQGSHLSMRIEFKDKIRSC